MAQTHPDIVLTVQQTFQAPIATVWPCFADFGNWSKWCKSFINMEIIGDGIDKIGCIRKFTSTFTHTDYEEELLDRDEANYTLKYGLVSGVELITRQITTDQLTAIGENQTLLTATLVITPSDKATPEELESFETHGLAGYKVMLNYLATYLQEQQQFPTIVITVQQTFQAPVSTVWPLIADFGNWSKWYEDFDGMKLEGDGVDRIGCIRKFTSKFTGVVYEENEIESDPVNHVFTYALVSSSNPKAAFIKNQVNIDSLKAIGENQTLLTAEIRIIPSIDVPPQMLNGFKTQGLAGYKAMYESLAKYLQAQQQYPDIVITVQQTFQAPVSTVWPLIADFANWGKWYEDFDGMKIEGDGVDKVGCIRKFTSKFTGTVYEESEIESDSVNHVFTYALVSSSNTKAAFIKNQVNIYTLKAIGENQTLLNAEIRITPGIDVPPQMLNGFKTQGLAGYKIMFESLAKYLEAQQQFPNIVITVQQTFQAPVSTVWPLIADFGNWSKWYEDFDGMKLEGDGVDCVGCIRKFTSKFTGVVYEENEIESDPVNHVFTYALVSSSNPKAAFIKNQVNIDSLKAIGENQTLLTAEIRITPSIDVPPQMLNGFKTQGLAGYKAMYESLAKYLQSQQQFPDIVITIQQTFQAPVSTVWPLLTDFANWGKWYEDFDGMKIEGDGVDKIGCIRQFTSKFTGVVYEENEIESDSVNHVFAYGNVSSSNPKAAFIKNQVTTDTLKAIGKNQTLLTAEIRIIPGIDVPPQMLDGFKTQGLAGYKVMYDSLAKYLQSQQQFPDIVITIQQTFQAPVSTVWPLLTDFANWGKWYEDFDGMKIEGDGVDKIGCIRQFTSKFTGVVYEENEIESDSVNHVFTYGNVSSSNPKAAFIKNQTTTDTLKAIGENQTLLTAEIRIIPGIDVPPQMLDGFKTQGLAGYKVMYDSLAKYLQAQQQYPDIVITVQKIFQAPVSTVWPLIADFGNWSKWYAEFDGMKIEGDGVDKIGCIRKFTSKFTGTVYQENEIESDSVNHVFTYALVSSSDTKAAFIKNQLNIYTLKAIGENQTFLTAEIRITPGIDVPPQMLDGFKTQGLAGYKVMYESLASYLQTQQQFPDIIINFEQTFEAPIETVWPLIADFGNWGKWYADFDGMKIEGDGVDKIGCIRKFTSKFTGTVYQETEIESDPVNHVFTYALVSSSNTKAAFIKNQVTTDSLKAIGEKQTHLTAELRIIPGIDVPPQMLEGFKTQGLAGYKVMYDSLAKYLEDAQQIIITVQQTFQAPIATVWPCFAEFGNWGKWYPDFADMKIEGDGVDKIGCIRKFTSKFTGTLYEEDLIARDETTHTLTYNLVSNSAPYAILITKQSNTDKLQAIGENQTLLTAEIRITPSDKCTPENLEQFKTVGLAGYKKMLDSLASYLRAQEKYPEIVIPFEYFFSFPIDTVWAAISDFGGWDKWCLHIKDLTIQGDGIDKIGCIRKFSSKQSGNTYEENEIEKDAKNYVLSFGIVSQTPKTGFAKNTVCTDSLQTVGENETKLIGEVRITPSIEVNPEMLQKFRTVGLANEKVMLDSLEKYLQAREIAEQKN